MLLLSILDCIRVDAVSVVSALLCSECNALLSMMPEDCNDILCIIGELDSPLDDMTTLEELMLSNEDTMLDGIMTVLLLLSIGEDCTVERVSIVVRTSVDLAAVDFSRS